MFEVFEVEHKDNRNIEKNANAYYSFASLTYFFIHEWTRMGDDSCAISFLTRMDTNRRR
jgi:hypothetical protein